MRPRLSKPCLSRLLLKASRPSALFPVTQHMTFGALKTIGEVGLDLPNDLSLLAFDDCEWFRRSGPFYPPSASRPRILRIKLGPS